MYDFSGSNNSSDLVNLGLDFLRHRIVPHSEQTDQFRNRYILDQHQGQFYGPNQQPVNVQPTNVKIIPATPASGTNTGTGQRNVASPSLLETTTNPALDPGLRPGEKVLDGRVVDESARGGFPIWIAGTIDAIGGLGGATWDFDKRGSADTAAKGGLGRTYDPSLKQQAIAEQKAAKEKVISKQDEQEKYLRDTERLKQSLGLQRQHEVGMIDQLAQRSLELARARTQMNLDASLGYEKSSPRVAQAQRKLASDAFSNEQIAMAQAAAAAGQAMSYGAQRRVGRG